MCISLCLLGSVIMIAADAQKFFVLRERRALITDGMFRYVRHPNYLGEMMIYASFALMVWHWLPLVVLTWVWLGVFAPNMALKEASLARQLLKLTALRLQASSRREESLAFFDARERLARTLLSLDQLSKARGYITLSQEELAQRTGMTRQTVAAVLGDWRRNGWLLTGRGHIVILNRGALHLMVENLEIPL